MNVTGYVHHFGPPVWGPGLQIHRYQTSGWTCPTSDWTCRPPNSSSSDQISCNNYFVFSNSFRFAGPWPRACQIPCFDLWTSNNKSKKYFNLEHETVISKILTNSATTNFNNFCIHKNNQVGGSEPAIHQVWHSDMLPSCRNVLTASYILFIQCMCMMLICCMMLAFKDVFGGNRVYYGIGNNHVHVPHHGHNMKDWTIMFRKQYPHIWNIHFKLKHLDSSMPAIAGDWQRHCFLICVCLLVSEEINWLIVNV